MKHTGINIRKTHPGLYHMIMTLCVMRVALAFNFWYSNPTFNPLGVSKNIVGVIFFVLGASQLIFLNVYRDLRLVRIVMMVSIIVMMFWGLTNTQQYFQGNASLQLPILYVALAIVQVPLLIESPVNPMTERK